MVTLSESVMKIHLKRNGGEITMTLYPVGNKILLSQKPRCLRNHASEIKSYYGTILGSHCPSFRIRHIKEREAPPGGEFTMTS